MLSNQHKPANKELLRLVVSTQRTMQKYKEKKSLYLNAIDVVGSGFFPSSSKSTSVTRMLFKNTCSNYRLKQLKCYLY